MESERDCTMCDHYHNADDDGRMDIWCIGCGSTAIDQRCDFPEFNHNLAPKCPLFQQKEEA